MLIKDIPKVPWWYDYVKEAIQCIEDKDFVEAVGLLEEIVDNAIVGCDNCNVREVNAD